jgi:hypothetical protein
MMDELSFSETTFLTQYGILHSHHCEKLDSYTEDSIRLVYCVVN